MFNRCVTHVSHFVNISLTFLVDMFNISFTIILYVVSIFTIFKNTNIAKSKNSPPTKHKSKNKLNNRQQMPKQKKEATNANSQTNTKNAKSINRNC